MAKAKVRISKKSRRPRPPKKTTQTLGCTLRIRRSWSQRLRSLVIPAIICAGLVAIGVGLGTRVANASTASSRATRGYGPQRPNVMSQAGPREMVDGVPVGYERSEAGAVAAATAYIGSVSELVNATPEAAAAGVKRMMVASVSEAAGMEFAESYIALRASLLFSGWHAEGVVGPAGPTGLTDVPGIDAPSLDTGIRGGALVRLVPVSHTVDITADDGRAQVRIWAMSLVAVDGAVNANAQWHTHTVNLIWDNADWRVSGGGVIAGPAPAWREEPRTPTAELLSALSELSPYAVSPELKK